MLHSLSALSLRLYQGAVSLEPLRVLRSRRVFWGEDAFTLSILGASHAVSWEAEGETFTELLTCAPPLAQKSPLVLADAQNKGAFRWQAQGRLWVAEVSSFDLAEGDALRGEWDEAMCWQFGGEREAFPVTRVAWRAAENAFWVQTLHTYPEEGRGVLSQSRFERTQNPK